MGDGPQQLASVPQLSLCSDHVVEIPAQEMFTIDGTFHFFQGLWLEPPGKCSLAGALQPVAINRLPFNVILTLEEI